MATIAEVAAAAGVSVATVSRVLNDKPVSPKLAVEVRRAINELNYSPNRMARSLRRRHSEAVALILPDIENPFFTALARGVENVAQQLGYSVVLCNSDDDVAKEARYFKIVTGDSMAGVIIAAASDATDVTELVKHGCKVVAVDRPITRDIDHVIFDNRETARRAVGALIDKGYQRIGCITGPEQIITARERAEGWRAGLEERGLPALEELLVFADYRVDGGRAAMSQLLRLASPPDAVLATNNLVGVGVLQALAGRQNGGPGVGVVGNLPYVTSDISDLSLTPLSPREMGETAARMLFERIRGDFTSGARFIVIGPRAEVSSPL